MQTIERLDPESCYRAVKSRDRRFDGVFYCGVRTTGIYCRPSCPARTPAYANITYYPSPAAAQAAGFRACKRCLPDATPGSPDWDVAATAAGRAMRLIADGVVDREGVEGLAHRVGYTPRHLSRLLTSELGAGPLALARAKRAQTARVLIETTDLSYADVAFAAGFSSVRQFNETVREVYAASPTQLRGRRGGHAGAGTVTMRLAVRTPYAGGALHAFLAIRAIPGVEAAGPGWYSRTLALPNGSGTMRLDLPDVREAGQTAFVTATFRLTDLRDTAAATERARRLLDADCDPVAVADSFAGDPLLGPLVRTWPGLRVPGHVDGNEIAVRAVLGQQVSVAAARTVAARLTAEHGRPLPTPEGELTHSSRRSTCWPASTPSSCRCRVRAAAPSLRCARHWPPATWPSTVGRTATTPGGGCWRCPASARGQPTTSRCARSAIPTCSCRPTSASATHWSLLAGIRPRPPSWPTAGDPGAPTRSSISGRP